jgi:DNA-binding transcriptional ArsR family regulator
MLDMNLVQGKPVLKADFRVSLAASLIDTVSMVVGAPWHEGFDQWVYATHAALPPSLKSDLEIAMSLVYKCSRLYLWLTQLPPNHPAHDDFAAFIAWLNAFSTDDYGDLVQDTLAVLAQHYEKKFGSPFSLENIEAILEATFGENWSTEQIEQAVHLARNPAELKAQFISTLTRFWEQFYRQEYQRALPLAERSVKHHRQQDYGADLSAIFAAVAGRRFPRDLDEYEDVERVIFFPSCYVGPYVLMHDYQELRPTIIIFYNCRPTGAPEHDQAPAVQEIFPPLRALADETRLQILSLLNGRELYAQEIVNNLDISQSAVSRHLKLMITGGLLTVRKKDSMKYLSIKEETLTTLADRLREFRSKG